MSISILSLIHSCLSVMSNGLENKVPGFSLVVCCFFFFFFLKKTSQNDCCVSAVYFFLDFPGGTDGIFCVVYALLAVGFNQKRRRVPRCVITILKPKPQLIEEMVMKPGKVICYMFLFTIILGVDRAQNLTKYNRWLRVFKQLTNRNVAIT